MSSVWSSASRFNSRFCPSRNLHLALCLVALVFCALPSLFAESRVLHITQHYLNIPISRQAKPQLIQISVDGSVKREFPVQLATDAIDYWIFIEVSEFKGQTITLSGAVVQPALIRIEQSNHIHDAAGLYKEVNRPQFHFTVKRGWNNDVNGPIFYKGQYHLFWQAFPFGVSWDTGFMYWGHAVSKDMTHWRELDPALIVDKTGSPWSGSSIVDHNNDSGWGKDALVLIYTAFDRVTHKQVQCIAYSTDNGSTFTHYPGNPVLDTNTEVGSNDTRDPHVFWYAPTHRWVMVLFEQDGMSIFNSTDLKTWTRKSHLKGFHECPDLFELPIDGDTSHTKWIIHGGSSSYSIGTFDGSTFTPESPELHYAEGRNSHNDDLLYASQSFAEMPDGRRVQMAWGRIEPQGMAFNQMMLFPTEFKLRNTRDGLRLLSTPIDEIKLLHTKHYAWSSLTASDANQKLHNIAGQPMHLKAQYTLAANDTLTIQYQGSNLVTIPSKDLEHGAGSVEILIDKCVAEIFIDSGRRYIVREVPSIAGSPGFDFATGQTSSRLDKIDVFELKSMWSPARK